MPNIVIIGAGFAGVWSAASAMLARGDADLRVTLIAPNQDMVLRPRLYEADPERATVALERILKPIGVEHLPATVDNIDVDAHRITADGQAISYDRLVLAAGSTLIRPSLPGAEQLFDVDTLQGARRLAGHLRGREGFTVVVVGAGFTGLEVATELAGRGRVVLVEQSDVVGPDLGAGPRPVIEAALDELRIERRLGTTLTAVADGQAVLSDGTRLAADAVVWTAGSRANPLTEQIPGVRDRLGRLKVDEHLRVGGDVFAAGDVAAAAFDADHDVMQSCQHATPLGKTAGYNATADLLGMPLKVFTPAPYVTCLDLGAAGAFYANGWDRDVAHSGTEGKKIKQWIMDKIQPPTDDADTILTLADMIYAPLPF